MLAFLYFSAHPFYCINICRKPMQNFLQTEEKQAVKPQQYIYLGYNFRGTATKEH
jgi:hypothetical protein